MYCKNCGKMVKEGAAFCASCGASIAAESMNRGAAQTEKRPMRPKKEHAPMSKKKKTCLIFSVIAAVLAAAVGFGSIFYLKSPARKAAILFADGKTAAAFELYDEEEIEENKLQSWIFSVCMDSECKKKKKEYENNKINCENLLEFLSAAISTSSVNDSWKNTYNEILNQRCDKIKSAFGSGEMSYSAARQELNALGLLDLYGTGSEKYTDAALALVEYKQAQLTKYDEAIDMYESGDLEGAIERLSSIDEESPKYAEAQEKYAAAVEAYRSDVVQNVNDFIERNDFSQAIILLKHALRILDGDEELTGMLESCEERYAEDVRYEAMTRSTELIADKEYAQALKVLAEALDKLGQDLMLQSAYDDCVSVYVKDVVAKADQLMQDKAFSDAIGLVNKALQVLPDNSILLAKKAEIEDKKPVPISTLRLIDSYDWSVNEYEPVDIFGNLHMSEYTCVLYNSNSMFGTTGTSNYAEYRSYGEYSILTGTISPYQYIEGAIFRIYLDDVMVEWYEIGKKTDPIHFEIDISNADYIRFDIGLSYRSGVILSDVLLWK